MIPHLPRPAQCPPPAKTATAHAESAILEEFNRFQRPAMKFRLNRVSRLAAVAAAILKSASLHAAGLPNGDFEAEPFLTGWSTAGTVVPFGGLAPGSTRSAWLASSGTARVGQNVTWDAEWFLDFYFAITNTANRSFSLLINVGADAANSGAATINLRCQSGVFNAYSAGSWGSDLGLGMVTPSQDANGDGDFGDAGDTRNVYRMRLTGHDWGLATARYDLALSAANATNFAVTVTNLTRWHNGSGVNGPPTAFLFNTIFGGNPGFWVDDVTSAGVTPPQSTNAIVNISGTYPHLAVFSNEGEIGMGAVVPWADGLWFVTYPPHNPNGGADKLWTLDTNLTLAARPESVGGTHANRMIHRESQQLVIGPYFIDTNANVRVVSPSIMPGRLTANARHLSDPTNQIYFASMEEGFYSVNVNTLAVTTLKPDAQTQTSGAGLILSGNHGKGFYSGQGRVVYANNGETSWSVGNDLSGFNQPAGLLAENSGGDFTNGWSTLERKNFTEVTGPGGIYGNASVADPIWAVGWDKRSVLLKLLDHGTWLNFRLPKGSYTHDSFQGWYTEWPRIREINDGKLLMHMHGLFYFFPKSFSAADTAGINPICTYLKMPVDYCWWNGQLVMGRDDSSTTGGNIWAGQSHSAPWFGQLSDLEKWGTPAGFGGPWKDDAVTAATPSEPFLVAGFKERVLHLKHTAASAVNFALQHDPTGIGAWTNLATLNVPANGYAWHLLPPTLNTIWVRLVSEQNASGVTAFFHLANPPQASTPELFAGIADATATNNLSDGILRPKNGDARTLQFATTTVAANGAATTGYYEIDGALQLRRTTNASAENTLRTTYSLSNAGFTVDAASVVYTEGANRFRLPKNSAAYDAPFASGWPRGAREVVTERRLFQAHGTFYELPLSGSGGFRRVRPITTHQKHISDFGSWRGLFAVAGLAATATNNGHVFRSEDGQAALWFGNVDDLWRMGAPAGVGGPWKVSAVTANTPSDPYLMLGYERKVLELSHTSTGPVTFTVEVDFCADNTWSEYARFTVQPGQTVRHPFPDGYSVHWVRLRCDTATTATAAFTYGPAGPQFTSVTAPGSGGVQLTFSGLAGQPYTVRATSDVSANLAGWISLTNGIFGPEPVRFTDSTGSNSPHRFYVIASP
jgi:hypothetical protein